MKKTNTFNRIIGIVIIIAAAFYCIPELKDKVLTLIKSAKEL